MGSLVEVLKDNHKRSAVITDCEQMLEAEVADKKGLSGVAVKGAFKLVKKFKPGMIRLTLDDMIDELAEKVDPFWKECQSSGDDAGSFFQRKKVDVANALLGITDGRMERSPNRGIKKAYSSLRPKAVDYIGQAMPRFSAIIKKHASD